MQHLDLLAHVQPVDGWYAITGIKGKGDVQQELVATREEADEVIERYVSMRRNVFFGVAKYASGGSRKKENVRALRAFWLDLDCGPAKVEPKKGSTTPAGYIDQRTGLEALGRFCKIVGLSIPTIVDSGSGIHAYWPITEEITRDEWEHVADRLKEVCRSQKLYVDDAVFEVARVLRVPGTFNYKTGTPVPVSVLRVGKTVELSRFKELLGVSDRKPTIFDDDWRPNHQQQLIQRNIGYSFRRILDRSLEGTGCAQIANAYNNRDKIGYEDWFLALSVAAMCDDADWATHALSDGHPDYDPEKVDKKVATIKKTTWCNRFYTANPEVCEGCPHRGKISAPRDLGKVLKEAPDEPEDQDPFMEAEDSNGKRLPEYPYPFKRGANGGIWRVPPKSDTEAVPMLVYVNDLFVVKRMNDSADGDLVLFNLYLPQDGVREFAVPMFKVIQRDEFRKALAAQGVACNSKQFELLQECVVMSINEIQNKEKAEIMRQQFGWVDGNSRFVLGDQEITADGNIYSPPSRTTQKLARFIGPAGSYEKWREVWALYGMPGMEPQAFAALSAFGAPLLKFLNQTGAVINLFNARSGTGKTTILNMVNSVYGHPKELRLKEIDTINGKLQWVGILNNLPATMDELTNATPKDYSDFLYSLSNGKGKERMMSGSNELRENNTTWQNITVSTSNSSFVEKLSVLKDNPEGELMRLIEYPIGLVDELKTAHAKNMFDTVLFHNYGHAGPIFIRYVLNNMERVLLMCEQMQAKIDRELNLLPKERFWSATMAANIVGGMVASRCKILDWEIPRIYAWACDRVEKLRLETDAPLNDVEQVVGDYLYRHMQNILVVDDAVDRRSNLQKLPKREPKGELLIRIEPDTQMMYMLAKPFKAYCVQYQINYNETLRKLEANGRLVKRDLKRISKGMAVNGDPIHCLWFKLDDDFINVGEYTKGEEDAKVATTA